MHLALQLVLHRVKHLQFQGIPHPEMLQQQLSSDDNINFSDFTGMGLPVRPPPNIKSPMKVSTANLADLAEHGMSTLFIRLVLGVWNWISFKFFYNFQGIDIRV